MAVVADKSCPNCESNFVKIVKVWKDKVKVDGSATITYVCKSCEQEWTE